MDLNLQCDIRWLVLLVLLVKAGFSLSATWQGNPSVSAIRELQEFRYTDKPTFKPSPSSSLRLEALHES